MYSSSCFLYILLEILKVLFDTLHYWSRSVFISLLLKYARFTTVHLVGIWDAKQGNGTCYRLLQKILFTANKANNTFSNIRINQNHKQLNGYLKKSGVFIGLTEDSAALGRFLVYAPLLTELCNNFEISVTDVRDNVSAGKIS